ncbi:MAG: lipoyl(octanoyl) transferase LipB [Candidatus Hydrogenedentes bacterium]|nr:lipoyl(octanoyl) transferase LipB [Candidatus Hydrogenedentota bacterium]
MIPSVNCIRMSGLVDYKTMLAKQRAVQQAVASGDTPSTLFLLEHIPTITLGRNALRDHVLCDSKKLTQEKVDIITTDRGGDVSYHGPGQLVAYPVFNLHQWQPSVDWYLRTLEETVIQILGRYGLKGDRIPKYTGVWVEGAKVAAIGIAIKHWVSWHGFALNINPNMEHWRLIVPCGIKNKPITSLAQLLPAVPPMQEVITHCIAAFEETFACTITETTLDEPKES